jgi:uncharacterized delta-60 repeat protein
MLDPLELRRLLAIPVSAGIATINGTGGNDVLEIINNAGTLQLRNGAGTVIDSVAAAGVLGVVVNAGDGNDFVRFGRSDGSLMPAVNATIRGNPGNDTLIGSNGNDQIFGDIDNDKLDGRAGADLLDGSSGFDTVDYGYRTVPVRVSLLNNGVGNDGSSSGNNSSPAQYNDGGADNVANMEAVVGGTGADRLVGSAAANWFDGGGGNDSIFGGAGIDSITGSVNNDLAYGEDGDDFFFMQDSTGDQFLGGAGVTSAQFDSGVDTPAPAISGSPTSFAPRRSLRGLRGFSPRVGPEDDNGLELDTTFGPDANGKVTTSFGEFPVQINDVALQTVTIDGGGLDEEQKILVVGRAAGDSETDDFVIIRYNADGSLDSTFGPDNTGIVYTDFGFGSDSASSVAVDDEGNIIVAGSTLAPNIGFLGFTDFAVAKYDSDGNLDDSFGEGGQVILDPDGLPSDADASRIAIQQFNFEGAPVDFYVVAGTIGPADAGESSESQDFGIVRLDSSGAFDESFGLVRADFGSEGETRDTLTGLAINPATNDIWASGSTGAPGNADFAVAGFFDDGSPIGGARTTLDFGGDDQASDAVIHDNQLLVVGTSTVEDSARGAIAAFDIEVPPALGPGSVIDSTLVEDPDDRNIALNGIAIDNAGLGVAVGTIGGNDFFVHRFTTSNLDAVGDPTVVDFGFEGGTFDQASSVAVQSDGKIVVAGTSENSAAVARLQSGSFVDVTLSPEDVQNFNFTYIDDNGNPQPVPNFLVQRVKALKPDGTLEVFGTDLGDVITVTQADGIITVNTNGDLFQVPAVQVTKVVVHGLAGDDVIDTNDSLSVPLIFEGDEGNDCLRGGSQADQFSGGPGNDLLVTRGGADVLLGGDGFDILIGGLGADVCRGGAGEDILIGGFTAYDNNLPSLKSALNEWSNPNHNSGQRFGQLQGSGGGSGLNGNSFLKPGQTVFDDNAADVLEGGADDDWFFAKGGSDTVLDQGRKEHLSKL